MKKQVLLYGGIMIILLSLLALYNLLAPRVGPIGNGMPINFIWIFFSITILIGITFVVLSIFKFMNEHKNIKN
ncbi:hypothetical protein ACRC6Q_08430 [Planococcus sp. SE5232]|uniref:hypothetical protein n=1 Tax=unclassified Planococcus (in: firmicutes) TaxID=2662419 RepID=UPI003D6ACFEE